MTQCSPRALFFISVLMGHAIYATRASLLLPVAFMVPWRHVPQWLKNFWGSPWGKAMLLLALSGVYIEIFGEHMGTIFGKTIKMDGDPHLWIALYGLVPLWMWQNRATIKARRFELWGRGGIVTAGFALGLAPEILHRLVYGNHWTPQILSSFDVSDSMKILAALPLTFRSLVSGLHDYRDPIFYQDIMLQQHICVMLVLSSMYATYKAGLYKPHYLSWLALVGLNVMALLRVSAQTSEIAPVRYLIPMTPVLIGMMAVAFERMSAKPFFPGVHFLNPASLFVVLLAVFCLNHIVSRVNLIDHVRRFGQIEEMKKIVSVYRREGVDAVISNDYWMSNNLTLLSAGKPYFWATWNFFGPFSAEKAAHAAIRAGILIKKDPKVVPPALLRLQERVFALKQQVGETAGYWLYIGEYTPL